MVSERRPNGPSFAASGTGLISHLICPPRPEVLRLDGVLRTVLYSEYVTWRAGFLVGIYLGGDPDVSASVILHTNYGTTLFEDLREKCMRCL